VLPIPPRDWFKSDFNFTLFARNIIYECCGKNAKLQKTKSEEKHVMKRVDFFFLENFLNMHTITKWLLFTLI
jgi:hypothetical protein